jgi:hypothetical protein
MWIEFDSIEELGKWANTHSRPTARFQLFTNAREGAPIQGPIFVVLRPSVGGRVDTGVVRIDASPATIEKILKSQFFEDYRANGRVFYVRDYKVAEDSRSSFDAARLMEE